MAKVIFYEKPECQENQRQKAILAAAGHEVETRDLLTEHWTAAGLRAFFAETPVKDWFDPAAPRVVSGEIDPASINPQEALVKMSLDPSLIKRPLMKFGSFCVAGFDAAFLDRRLGIRPGAETPDVA
jgi:nitrogenase-associated protein